MKLIHRRTSSIIRITILIIALSLQACATGSSKFHNSKHSHDLATKPLAATGATSRLKVKGLKPPMSGRFQGHIKPSSEILITEDSNNRVTEIKFLKVRGQPKDYTFKNVIEGVRISKGRITLVPLEASQACERDAPHAQHKISAVLAKWEDTYVAIDFEYWDVVPSLPGCEENPDAGHGRGGGGGWN